MRIGKSFISRVLLSCLIIGAGLAWIPLKCCSRNESPSAAEELEPKARQVAVRTEKKSGLAAWNRGFSRQNPPPAELRPITGDHTGILENGIRFAVMECPDAPGEVSLRLLVLAGSIHEDADERGLAHFVEHMAFRRTARRRDGQAMEGFQRLGLRAGADANAHTAVDHTLYRLDLPEADEESLEAAMNFFRDAADGLLFDPADVESERAVILRELAEREAGEAFALRSAAILPGVRAAENLPRGLKEVVESATPARLREFWHRNYTSSRMTVVAAGDLDAADMIARIRRHFGPIAARIPPAEPEPGNPLADRQAALRFVPHEATTVTRITIAAPHPIKRQPDTIERRREQVARAVALQMLEARLGRRFESRNIRGLQPQLAAVELSPGIGWMEISSTCGPGREAMVLHCIVEETRRALAHGFARREFAEARGEIRRQLRANFARRQSAAIADSATAIAESIRTGRILESPHDELNRCLTTLADLDNRECQALFRADWSHAMPRIVISGVVSAEIEETAQRVIDSIPALPPPLPEDHSRIPPLVIESPGPAGEIVEKNLVVEPGYLEARFANQVVVRLAPIPSIGGHVEVRVRVRHGRQSLPMEQPGIAAAAEILGQWYPTEGWQQLTLKAALAEEDVSMDFRCENDAFQWSGTTHRAELRRQLEILRVCATRPGALEAGRLWTPSESLNTHMTSRAKLMHSQIRREFTRLITGSDPRFETLPLGLMDTDGHQVAEWLRLALTRDGVCIVITGDFEPLQALEDVAATFGALPARRSWVAPSPYPGVTAQGGGTYQVPADGKTKTGAAAMLFPLGAPTDSDDAMRRWILAELLQLRLRSVMRESLGESYSPRTGLAMSPDDREQWLIAHVPCAAGRENEVGPSLRELVREMAGSACLEDEFQRAVRPLPHVVRKAVWNPSQLAGMLWNPERMPTLKKVDAASLGRMNETVRQLARQVFGAEAAIELRVMAEE
jgi:zinc protease